MNEYNVYDNQNLLTNKSINHFTHPVKIYSEAGISIFSEN